MLKGDRAEARAAIANGTYEAYMRALIAQRQAESAAARVVADAEHAADLRRRNCDRMRAVRAREKGLRP